MFFSPEGSLSAAETMCFSRAFAYRVVGSACLPMRKQFLDPALELAVGAREHQAGWRVRVDDIQEVNPVVLTIMPPF